MTTALLTTNGTQDRLVDLQIEAEVTEIRAINEQIKLLEDSISARKVKLRTLLERRGESWTDDNGGYARLMKDSTRVTYDREALDNLILRNPWWFSRLSRYRKESAVRGGVQVR